jgi:hypothetical protein
MWDGPPPGGVVGELLPILLFFIGLSWFVSLWYAMPAAAHAYPAAGRRRYVSAFASLSACAGFFILFLSTYWLESGGEHLRRDYGGFLIPVGLVAAWWGALVVLWPVARRGPE